jgi:GDP-L-fucose synthase
LGSKVKKGDRIYVAGHNGLVGSALVRALRASGYDRLLLLTRSDLDLTRQSEVERFFSRERPEFVFLAAAKVGGIVANDTYRAEFIRENLLIAANLIDAAWRAGCKRLLNLSSSCVYPRLAPQPLKEEFLLTGPLEPTNRPYAMAKLAAMEMVQSYRDQYGADFFSVIPTNLYGPNDNYDPESSHLLPALLHKLHSAKAAGRSVVKLWGTGTPRREFMYVDDLADACLLLMERYPGDAPINIGTGEDKTVRELAETVAGVVGYDGGFEFDRTRPDGTPRKLLDVSRLQALGWRPKTTLEAGIRLAYQAYLQAGEKLAAGR